MNVSIAVFVWGFFTGMATTAIVSSIVLRRFRRNFRAILDDSTMAAQEQVRAQIQKAVENRVAIADHIDKQPGPRFYCGQAFCGHTTKELAMECWQAHCDRYEAARRAGYPINLGP
jgi:hypothetical protein